MTGDSLQEILVVCAVMIDQGKLFAARRGPAMDQPGLWEFPGGKVEPTESPQIALQRELHEELQVAVAVGELLGESCTHQPARRRHIRLQAYRCSLVNGTPVAGEHDMVGWFPPNEAKLLAWCPADIPLLSIALSKACI